MPVRVNMYEEEIDKVVYDRSQNCIWERASVCNCVSKDTIQPNFNCPICGGSGFRYLPPKNINVAISSLSSRNEITELQFREPGTAYVTPTSDIIMGYRDRLIFPDFRCLYSEVIHWEDRETNISPRLYRKIQHVEFLADSKYEYEQDVDFKITADGYYLEWLNLDFLQNLKGKHLSILYYTTPSYLVDDLLHELRGTLSDRKSQGKVTFRELPKQYKIVRENFIYNIKKPEEITKDTTVQEFPDYSEGIVI